MLPPTTKQETANLGSSSSEVRSAPMSAYLTLEADTAGRLKNDTKEDELMSDISRVSHNNLGEDDIPREPIIQSVDIRHHRRGNGGGFGVGRDNLNEVWDNLRNVLGSVDNDRSSFDHVEDGLGDVRGSLIDHSIGFGSTVAFRSETDRERQSSGNAPRAALSIADVDRGDRAGGAT
jgi:hypothetical protein